MFNLQALKRDLLYYKQESVEENNGFVLYSELPSKRKLKITN